MLVLIAYKPERKFYIWGDFLVSPSKFINEKFNNLDLEKFVNRVNELETNTYSHVDSTNSLVKVSDVFTEILVFQSENDHATIDDLKNHLKEIKQYKQEQEESQLEPCEECGAKPIQSNGICH